MRAIAFYSFKGGTGRTTAAANVGAWLARERSKNVALVDLDLEGGGLHVVFGKEQGFRGIQRFLASTEAERPPLEAFALETGVSENLTLFPAEAGGPKDRPGLPPARTLLPNLDALEAELGSYDVVILDTPLGYGPMTQASFSLAHHLLIMTRVSGQSIAGTADIMGRLDSWRTQEVAPFFPVGRLESTSFALAGLPVPREPPLDPEAAIAHRQVAERWQARRDLAAQVLGRAEFPVIHDHEALRIRETVVIGSPEGYLREAREDYERFAERIAAESGVLDG